LNTPTDSHPWQQIADSSTPLEQRRHHEPPREGKPFPKRELMDWPHLSSDLFAEAQTQVPVLDLHGYTRTEAHALLLATIERLHAQHTKSLLVITGKGTQSEGVLRRKVPQWLDSPALSSFVRHYAIAPERLGGEGALMVKLRG
jgi:DNA-nicking Smr family endonuclease